LVGEIVTLTSVTDDGKRYASTGSGKLTIRWVAQGELSDGTHIPVTLWFPEDKRLIESAGYVLTWRQGQTYPLHIPVILRDCGNEWRIEEVHALDLTWVKRTA
jgi:hypothetical protein